MINIEYRFTKQGKYGLEQCKLNLTYSMNYGTGKREHQITGQNVGVSLFSLGGKTKADRQHIKKIFEEQVKKLEAAGWENVTDQVTVACLEAFENGTVNKYLKSISGNKRL